MGHQVDEAGCVEQALKLVEEMAYDCVLLDLAIPRSFEGPSNTNHGQTLLHRIVSRLNAPPVVVITANGLDSWQLTNAVYKAGAKGFIAKPFAPQSVENEIREQLSKRKHEESLESKVKEPFSGGDLVMHEDRIDLCGKAVGGKKGHALIRQILRQLARKNNAGHYMKASGKELAKAIGAGATAPKVTSAIQDFRAKCQMSAGCGPLDVITTCPGGGYRFGDKINFLIGSEERTDKQAESDQALVLKELRALKEANSRQIADRTQILLVRVQAALSKLDDERKIELKGSGANAVYSIREAES